MHIKSTRALRALICLLLCAAMMGCGAKSASSPAAETPSASPESDVLSAPEHEPSPISEPEAGQLRAGAQDEPEAPVDGEADAEEAAGSGDAEGEAEAGAAEPEAESEGDSESEGAPESEEPAAQSCVTATAAYHLTDLKGSSFYYAAVEFVNDTGAAAIPKSVTVEIDTGSGTVAKTSTPPVADQDIVAPGATSTAAIWIPTDKEPPEEGDAALAATASVEFEPAYDDVKRPLVISNMQLIQNYPLFGTASGCITNPSTVDSDLTIVYLSFYDADGAFLGTTYFTKNLAVPAAEARDFVVHLHSLPIPGLAENTATITARGFGVC